LEIQGFASFFAISPGGERSTESLLLLLLLLLGRVIRCQALVIALSLDFGLEIQGFASSLPFLKGSYRFL